MIRTPSDMKKWAEEADRSGQVVRGVKGSSVLSEELQLPQCVPVDYMHAVLDGVVKRLMKCWFLPSNYGEPYYIGGQHTKEVDRMVARIKPPSDSVSAYP